MIIKYFG
jgi:NADPH2:quinone reductase